MAEKREMETITFGESSFCSFVASPRRAPFPDFLSPVFCQYPLVQKFQPPTCSESSDVGERFAMSSSAMSSSQKTGSMCRGLPE